MNFGVYQLCNVLTKEGRSVENEIINMVKDEYRDSYEIVYNEYMETGRVSYSNEVEEEFEGTFEGRPFKLKLFIGEKPASMGKGIGFWLNDFNWI